MSEILTGASIGAGVLCFFGVGAYVIFKLAFMASDYAESKWGPMAGGMAYGIVAFGGSGGSIGAFVGFLIHTFGTGAA